MSKQLRNFLLLGVGIEIVLFALLMWYFEAQWGEVFRYAARISGRFSLLIFVYCFVVFLEGIRQEGGVALSSKYKHLILTFTVMHLIHFGFLAMNVYLNGIHLVPVRLLGGFLGYVLLVTYPWLLSKQKSPQWLHFFYFFYLSIVFLLTYVARAKGDFEGATPSSVHYAGLAVSGLVLLLDLYFFILTKRKS
ncbi:MAG: hypothetical protein U0Y10_22150 [Spirosomataceae bacterium]